MKLLVTLVLLLCIRVVSAQQSVYACQSNTQVTQTVINAAGSVFQQQCIEFPDTQSFLFNGSFNKEIKANTEIKIEPGFKAGTFTSTGGMKLTTTQKSDFDVVVMNYPDLMNVLKLEKFELGVALPSAILTKVNNFVLKANVAETEKLNPFLEGKLDVEATFTNSATGTVKKVDAFYYREYQRDVAAGVWTEIATNYTMRVRFSPPETGTWMCTIVIKVNTVVTAQSAPFSFKVVPSSNPGYVTVHANQRNLEQNGRMIFPVGINFDGPIKGIVNTHSGDNGDNYGPEDIDFTTTPQNFVTYLADIVNYKNQGGRFIRTLQNPWGALIEFTEKGNYYNRMHYAWEQDRLIDYAEANDMLIHFNLLHQEPFMKYGNYHLYDWDWSHYRSDGSYDTNDIFPAYCYANGYQKEPYEMFMLEDDLKYHEQRTRYYISRYGYSTSIYNFELLSESWHLNEIAGNTEPYTENTTLGANVRNAVQNYHQRISSYIKQTLGHTEHLVGIDIYSAKVYDTPNYIDPSISHTAIDVVSINPYGSAPDKLIIQKNASGSTGNSDISPNEISLFATVKKIQNINNKPVLIAEGGAGDNVDDCSNFVQQYVDMMTFGFSGIAGYNSWVGMYTGHEVTWQTTINAQNHMNGYDVIDVLSGNGGNWIQGREMVKSQDWDEKSAKEQQYYVSLNQEMAVGYVKNRTFNAYTQRVTNTPPNCTNLGTSLQFPLNTMTSMDWDQKKLTIQGLKFNTNYLIHWYDYKTGAYLSSNCENTNLDNDFQLPHPTLNVTSPVLWFVVEQNNCSNFLLPNPSNTPELEVQNSTFLLANSPKIDELNKDLEVFPNPFLDEFSIQDFEQIGHISIYNAFNQLVFDEIIENRSLTISTEKFASGVYTLLFHKNNFTYKLVHL